MPDRPLYLKPPLLPVNEVEPAAYSLDCRSCELGVGNAFPAEGEAGAKTLLVVTPPPGSHERGSGQLLATAHGTRVRQTITGLWPGPVRYVPATRCFGKPTEAQLVACRPHLAHEIAQTKPDRILALGSEAAMVLAGEQPNIIFNRRAYSWVRSGDGWAPLFYLASPGEGRNNPFLSAFFKSDLESALRVQPRKPDHFTASFKLVETVEEAETAAEAMRDEGFAFDLEWAGFMWDADFRLLCCGVACLGRPGLYMWSQEALNNPAVFAPLRDVLEDPDVRKGGSNVKADVSALEQVGVRVSGIEFDVRLQRKLLDPEASGYLEDMAWHVGMGGHKKEAQLALAAAEKEIGLAVRARKKAALVAQKQRGFDLAMPDTIFEELKLDPVKYAEEPKAIAYALVPKDILYRYCVMDSLSTARLSSRLDVELALSPARSNIYDKIVMPAARAFQRVESAGVPIDIGAVQLFQRSMLDGMNTALEKVQQYGKDLNPGSSAQVGALLFKKLKLKPHHLTDGGQPSTDDESLTALKGQHPLPEYVLEYRHYQKFSTFAADWLTRIRADGCIHGSINLDGARSGRTSMSQPNLQQIPRAADSADGKMARDCIAAPRGKILVQLDFSQQELRLASYLSRDDVMAALFRSGADFHQATAQLVSKVAWGIEPELVKKPHRTQAKTINFSLVYGKSVKTLAAELGISEDQAQKIVDAILGRFKKFAKWSREAIAYAKKNGGCWTYWEGERARWRPLWRIGDQTEEGSLGRSQARNGALNSPVQGTASEFCLDSVSKLVAMSEAGKLDARVVLPVHDSIMLVCNKNTWRETAAIAKHTMENYPWVSEFVPLKADVEVGERWGSLESVENL